MISIREMHERDLPEVRGLAEQLGYPVDLDILSQRFSVIDSSTLHKLFVACDDEKVIGWIHAGREMSSLLVEDRADIGGLIVDSKYRSKGIGANLLEAAEKWARSQDLNLVRVRSNIKRTEAHRFYQRQGYNLAKSWHLFTKEPK